MSLYRLYDVYRDVKKNMIPDEEKDFTVQGINIRNGET